MSEELEPLDADALAVLGQLGPVPDVPSGARDRIWRAVEARAALGALSTTRGETAPPPATGNALSRSGVGGWIARNPWGAVSAALLVGGAVGAGARGAPAPHAATSSSATAERAPSIAPLPPASSWTPVAVPAVPSSSSLMPPPSPPPTAPHPAAATSPASGTGQQLAAESALLDIARTAIERGESDHALVAVDRHASTFPNGMLREEREALGVKALVLAGRGDDARARAARFRARYPESLFLPALESTLRSIP